MERPAYDGGSNGLVVYFVIARILLKGRDGSLLGTAERVVFVGNTNLQCSTETDRFSTLLNKYQICASMTSPLGIKS